MTDHDIQALADLHRLCLDDSLVAAMGPAYVRSFYRYVTTSPQEVAVVERGDDGRIVAAAVVSLAPGTFNTRLLRHTTLALSMLTRIPTLARLALDSRRLPGCGASGPTHVESPTTPEMILLYAAPTERRRGRGRDVVRGVDEQLRSHGIPEYCVRTVLAPTNGALAFYDRCGFTRVGTSVRFGVCFQVFTKAL